MKEFEAMKGPHVLINDNERLQQGLRREGLPQICDAAGVHRLFAGGIVGIQEGS
jgi:hypothetical protein